MKIQLSEKTIKNEPNNSKIDIGTTFIETNSNCVGVPNGSGGYNSIDYH